MKNLRIGIFFTFYLNLRRFGCFYFLLKFEKLLKNTFFQIFYKRLFPFDKFKEI
jgi:hypothetical protein